MSSDPAKIPPPIPRLDPARLVSALAAEHGITLELVGAAAGGEVGAAYVRWPDGRESVLTSVGDDSDEWGERLRRTATVLELARARGVPVPRYDLVVPVDGTHVVIQERLAGTPPARPDARLVDRMIMVTEDWTGLLADFDAEPASLHLAESGPGFCLHESLAHYDDRTRRLLERVEEIGRSGPGVITGDDLVHLDYHLGNVLVDDDGVITGVIDWDGSARGDRWFALTVLSFDLSGRHADAALVRRVEELIMSAVPADTLRGYRAHLALRQVDWMIRHHGPGAVDHWLAIANDRLGSD
ncbi:phosphotransferase family protein [Microlunatus speluncae]|uniref:phosphotransferase family protein n=1 Tax=Microlunatus speluncae TaxID=2594267 RepID=UPI001375666E|nr:phosphotransferase [Microlunatus speluncae]